MCVYWLEQKQADVPGELNWLSPFEAARLNTLRIPKRRGDWLLGRWTAKRALARHWNLPAGLDALRSVEIRPAPSGAPEVFRADGPGDVAISISHRDGVAACAIGPRGMALGCDLEIAEPRSDTFVIDYFTEDERKLIAQVPAANRQWLVALLWSAKESLFKALHSGLRLDTRSALIIPSWNGTSPQWSALRARADKGQMFPGWWQRTDRRVRTIVTAPAAPPPEVWHLA
ncbi:MAG: hypothetical protein C5B51_02490 [Terriglobia bacterium]|nr:MAG: hypothetical protein C5B51_02490 [Terriglobia bacterium]